MGKFTTVLCVDGSASKQSKRPVYCFRREQTPSIKRFRHEDGVLAILDDKQKSELPWPLLITVDVPIGLPAAYEDVWKEFGGFLAWLDARQEADWETIRVNSVAKQTPRSPFVICQKGEKKRGGQFPLRQCEQRTPEQRRQGESLYWCVGKKQVGLAAVQFWRDTLVPLRKSFPTSLPFGRSSRLQISPSSSLSAILRSCTRQRGVSR